MYIAIKDRIHIDITMEGLSQKKRKHTNQDDVIEEFIRFSRSST